MEPPRKTADHYVTLAIDKGEGYSDNICRAFREDNPSNTGLKIADRPIEVFGQLLKARSKSRL